MHNEALCQKSKTYIDFEAHHNMLICGKSHSGYDKCPDTRNSVSGYSTFLCDSFLQEKVECRGLRNYL